MDAIKYRTSDEHEELIQNFLESLWEHLDLTGLKAGDELEIKDPAQDEEFEEIATVTMVEDPAAPKDAEVPAAYLLAEVIVTDLQAIRVYKAHWNYPSEGYDPELVTEGRLG